MITFLIFFASHGGYDHKIYHRLPIIVNTIFTYFSFNFIFFSDNHQIYLFRFLS